jgi:hypothetical protein
VGAFAKKPRRNAPPRRPSIKAENAYHRASHQAERNAAPFRRFRLAEMAHCVDCGLVVLLGQ